MQRAPWLRADAQPEIWLHDGGEVDQTTLRTHPQTIEQLGIPRKGMTPTAELAKAATGLHLRTRSVAVTHLVDWATENPLLDPGHRQSERSWHYMGQKVLSIVRTADGLRVTAGIHYSGANAPEPLKIKAAEAMTEADVTDVRHKVEVGMHERLAGTDPRINRRDEHWLQAVIRRNPILVRIEQPALRELPAWRPMDSAPTSENGVPWGRGYLDLVGMDGHGDLRIVETKIATNDDALLVLQGLDYFIWCRAYADVLRTRLGASPDAELEINFVVGANDDQTARLSRFTPPLANALDDSVRWRFQTVFDWRGGPEEPPAAWSRRHSSRVIP